MSGHVEITVSNFDDEVIKSAVPVLLDFWASWCGPCRMIAPFMDQLATEYNGRVKIGKINVDSESELAERHGVTSIPTLVVYRNGKVVSQKSGAMPKPEIEKLFKEFV